MQKSLNPRNIKFNKTRLIIFIAISGLGFLVDRLLKILAYRQYSEKEFFILPEYASFTLHKNIGIAFGIKLWPGLSLALTSAILFILALICIYFIKKRRVYFFASLLVFSGGLSNLIDRACYGHVVDYFYVRPYSFFNIADALIFCGCVLFIYLFWQNKPRHGK